MMTFIAKYDLPTTRCEVMKTAIFPHDHYEKELGEDGKLNLIYCSNPLFKSYFGLQSIRYFFSFLLYR